MASVASGASASVSPSLSTGTSVAASVPVSVPTSAVDSTAASAAIPPSAAAGQPLLSQVHWNDVAAAQSFGSSTHIPPLPMVHHPHPRIGVQVPHDANWRHPTGLDDGTACRRELVSTHAEETNANTKAISNPFCFFFFGAPGGEGV